MREKPKYNTKPILYVFLIALIISIGSLGVYMSNVVQSMEVMGAIDVAKKAARQTIDKIVPKDVVHVPIPKEVRGMYWTAYTAGISRADELIKYMKDTGLNTVVIDLKKDSGILSFEPSNKSLSVYASNKPAIPELDQLMDKLQKQDIYRIARIAVMHDDKLAEVHPEIGLHKSNGRLWYDSSGLAWVDPATPEVSDYAIALAREAYERGFDEVQFDYVRFPSDGALKAIVYPVFDNSKTMAEIMQDFWKKVGGTLMEEGIPVSFDLFGMTFWSAHDYNIGQNLVDVYPYADYISPMVYPSHYPDGFLGYSNPAVQPYAVVKGTLDMGADMVEQELLEESDQIRAKFRPWLQDFDIGAVYTAARIEAQIKAARDAGASGWLLWNARNVYEPAQYRP